MRASCGVILKEHKPLIAKLNLIVIMLSLLACNQSSLQQGADFPSNIIEKKSFLKSFVVLQTTTSSAENFVSEIQLTDDLVELPATLLTYSGERRNPDVPQRMDLMLKSIAIEGNFTNGDFYFESPILAAQYEINSVTTALSYWLRMNYSPLPSVSRTNWTNMLKAIESNCQNCIQKTTSEIYKMFQENQQLKNSIEILLINGCPYPINYIPFDQNRIQLVYIDPMLKPDSLTESYQVQLKESQNLTANALFFSIAQSPTKLFPDSWDHYFNETQIANSNAETYNYNLSFEAMGSHELRVTKNLGSQVRTYNLYFDVSNQNRKPVFSEIPVLTMIAGKPNRFTLPLDGIYDPDNDGLVFSLIGAVNSSSNITGLVISNGEISWTPTLSPNQLGLHRIAIMISDNNPQQLSISGILEINVIDNTPPTLSAPTSASFIEGASSQFSLTVNDAENDRICFKTKSSVPLITQLPAGAGILAITPVTSLPSDVGNCYTIESGSRQFNLSFTPSYMQALGADANLAVDIAINYSVSDGNIEMDDDVTASTILQITNMDDPPVWQTQPLQYLISLGQYLEEGNPISINGGWATDLIDPATAVNYYFVFSNNPECSTSITSQSTGTDPGGISRNFITKDLMLSQVVLSGNLNFRTSPRCQFQIRAIDSLGLYSDSAIFTWDILNVNQAMCFYFSTGNLCPGVDPYPTGHTYSIESSTYSNVTAVINEKGRYWQKDFIQGSALSDYQVSASYLNLNLIFRDPDAEDALTFTCLDCAAQGVTNYSIVDKQNYADDFGQFFWNPGFGSGGQTKTLMFRACDEANTCLDRQVTLRIIDSPGPMLITHEDSQGTEILSNGTLIVSEPPDPKATEKSVFQITPASSDPSDIYDFKLTLTGTLRAGAFSLIDVSNLCAPASNYGFISGKLTNLDTMDELLPMCSLGYTFTIQYNFDNTDGNSGNLSQNFKNYPNLNILIDRYDSLGLQDSETQSYYTWVNRVLNYNFAPTSIGTSSSSANSARLDTGNSNTTLTFSSSQVLGPSASSRTIYIYAQDPDTSNDYYVGRTQEIFTYPSTVKWLKAVSWNGTQAAQIEIKGGAVGGATGGCFVSSGTTFSRTVTLTANDGRGGTKTRNITIQIPSVSLIPSCN